VVVVCVCVGGGGCSFVLCVSGGEDGLSGGGYGVCEWCLCWCM
jgi:hypothetical protein